MKRDCRRSSMQVLRLNNSLYIMSSFCTHNQNILKKINYREQLGSYTHRCSCAFSKPRLTLSSDARLQTGREGCSVRNGRHRQRGHPTAPPLPNDVGATKRYPTSVTLVTHSIQFNRRFPVNTFHADTQLQMTRVATQEVILFICDVQLKSQKKLIPF